MLQQSGGARERSAMALVETLIALAVGVMILAIAAEAMTTSSRTLTRGQNKMDDTTQAELVFRWLYSDLHAALAAPVPVAAPAPAGVPHGREVDLALTGYRAGSLAKGALASGDVQWRLVCGERGRGSFIERAVVGEADRPARFCAGALADVRVDPFDDPVRPGLTVRLVLLGQADRDAATFQETFFYRNQVADPFWIPVNITTSPSPGN